MQNTFLTYFSDYTSIYKAISADLLHQIELGVHGKHFWPWIISKGDNPGYLSGEELDQLDDKYVISIVLITCYSDSSRAVSNDCHVCQESTTSPTAS